MAQCPLRGRGHPWNLPIPQHPSGIPGLTVLGGLREGKGEVTDTPGRELSGRNPGYLRQTTTSHWGGCQGSLCSLVPRSVPCPCAGHCHISEQLLGTCSGARVTLQWWMVADTHPAPSRWGFPGSVQIFLAVAGLFLVVVSQSLCSDSR